MIYKFSETKLDQDSYAKYEIKKQIPSQYLPLMNFCRSPHKRYSGSAFLTKFKPKQIRYGIGNIEHDVEGRWMTIDLGHDIYLVVVYSPNVQK